MNTLVLPVLALSLSPAVADGPLQVCRENPRYFADSTGKPMLLTGSHTWNSLQDMLSDGEGAFDWKAYLDILEIHGHNFVRLWRWELTILDAAAALVRSIDSQDSTFPAQFDEPCRLLTMRTTLSMVDSRSVVSLLPQSKLHYLGGFHRIRELVTSEVFDDLVEQVEHPLQQGYHLTAGARAGAVLEDSLRQLCPKHGVSWQGHSSVSNLNGPLYGAGALPAYDNSTQKNVMAWGGLRKDVDHLLKKPEDVDVADVKRMVEGVRDFIAKFLG